MSRSVLILGGGTMQIPAIESARSKGLRTIVADADPLAPGVALADVFENVDLKDEQGMLDAARRHYDKSGLHGVFTAGTDFSATVAFVADHLGLPSVGYEAAKNASDKHRMRECFRAAGVPHPDFAVVSANEDPGDSTGLARLNLPVVVKPVDNMGARGVVKVTERDRLVGVVADSIGYSRSGKVIVEEFIDGPEYSIDSMVIDGEVTPTGIADRHIRFEPYFVEVGHTIPTSLSTDETSRLVDVFARGVAALGIKNGVAKGDVFMGPSGPMIGEIAARLSGGYMSGWTFPYASGVDLTGAALNQAVGDPPGDLRPTRNDTTAERALISVDGLVREVVGIPEARSTTEVRELFCRVRAGEPVRFPRNNVEKCANVIATARERDRAVSAAEAAIASMVVRLVPNRLETHRFLFSPNPPRHVCYPEIEKWARSRFRISTTPLGRSTIRGPLSIAQPAYPPSPGEDWSYRTVDQSLSMPARMGAVRFGGAPSGMEGIFWLAVARAGVQGALYLSDSLADSPELFRRRFQSCNS
jgi:biotin carboxylase